MALSARILPTIPRAMGVRLLATAVLVSFAATITLAQTARPSGPVASPPEYLETPCAVIAGGKETHLEGNKDAVDFNDKLLNYQEWQDPSKPGVRQHRPGSVIVLPNANNDEIKEAIEKKLGKKNCSLLVFFWSGHGDYKEKNNPGKKAYLSLKGGGRVYTRDLGDWLKNFQDNHLVKHALGGAQFRKDPAPVLMILQ